MTGEQESGACQTGRLRGHAEDGAPAVSVGTEARAKVNGNRHP